MNKIYLELQNTHLCQQMIQSMYGRRYYGEDALEAADAMASKLEKGTSFKNYE